MEEVFSEPPKSFNLTRKSNFASELKSLISHRLSLFYPQFSDDVLAEYITVLVCNGKNQNQARDDLEAFLGERTQEFISWLWKFLLKNETQLINSVSSSRKDKINVSGTSENCQSQENSEGECEKISLSRQACKSGNMEPPKNHHPHSPKETRNSLFDSSDSQTKIATFGSARKVLSSVIKYPAESVDVLNETATMAQKGSASVHGSASVAKFSHCTKLLDKNSDSISGRYPASLPEKTPDPETHFSEVNRSGSDLKRKLYLPSVTPSSHTKKPRQSVWDRLGKPKHNAPSRSQTAGFHAMDKNKRIKERISQSSPLFVKPAKQIDHVSPLPIPPGVESSKRLRQVHQIAEEDGAHKIGDTMRLKHVATIDYEEVPCTGTIIRKKQFGESVNHTNDGIAMERSADKQLQRTFQSNKISEQVNDVKLRLSEIEKEMVMLRTKKILMEKDGSTNLPTNLGVVKPTRDESRTVLVTNVHVKATKETLSMFFQKCGAVVDVVMFTDCTDSAQERSAYITFQRKVAAERALRFTGASFYSRTIKVSRKGGNPSTTTGQMQIAGNADVSLAEQHDS